MNSIPQDVQILDIDSLAFGGAGVGRLEGKAVFVPLSAPGDRVRCRILRQKKRFAEAELLEVLEPSSMRKPAPCPHFGVCGGCRWQHLGYEDQCSQKETIFRDMLVRQAGVAPELIRPLAAAPSPWGYRSRAQLKCRMTPSGFVMGFYRQGSHFVIDVPHCAVLHPALDAAARALREPLSKSPEVAKIPQLDLGVGDDGAVRAVVHYLGERLKKFCAELAPLAEALDIALFVQTGRKESLHLVRGPENLFLEVEGCSLGYGPGGFAQINLEQNRALVRLALEALEPLDGKRILDLFCGMGNFTLPLAQSAQLLVGVEDYAPSIASARENAARNSLSNVRFHTEPASGAFARHAGQEGFDAVLLDPPRSGAYEVIKDLLFAAPRHLLYVSCDPATLARDLVPLLHGGYRLLWSRPLDMFPQTHHVESISLLQRLPS